VVSGPVGLVFPAPDAPFSARQVEERTRIAPGGTSSTETLVSQIYRDSAGRMRIEWRFQSPQGDSFAIVELIDPVARSYGHVARRLQNSRLPRQAASRLRAVRVIDGVEAEGERIVQTSGDQPPLIATRETWWSRTLRLTFVVEASGPNWRHTAKLQNLDLHEPDPALFGIPPDYTIQDQ
jgi:hypothetical protein